MDAATRIAELTRAINEHNHAYYILNAPSVTDEEFDALFRELQQLEAAHPDLADPNSPTTRIGAIAPTDFEKVKHGRKMLSLQNVYNADEVIKYFGLGAELVMEPKVDGLSLRVKYVDGKLVQAVTRGNGMHGDDVTTNARTIHTIPLVLQDPVSIEVTGEVYMTFSVFNALNDELLANDEEPFANARNAAAGTLKLKNPTEVARRQLSFCAHGTPNEIEGIETHAQLVQHLECLGFQSTWLLPVTESTEVCANILILEDRELLMNDIDAADKRRRVLNLATDGLVFKVNSLAKQRDLGEGTRAPKWAAAYKFPPERKATKLLDITVQVGKTGKLTPVAELEPVNLSGTVVRRASLCNGDEIERLQVDIGDTVFVEKSAEIIPKVIGVQFPWLAYTPDGRVDCEASGGPPNPHEQHKKSVWRMPSVCPSCQGDVVRETGLVDHYCRNPECPEQIFSRLRYSCGKSCLDIDGCGDETVRLLMQNGVRRLSDVFTISSLSFLKPAARQRFVDGRERAKRTALWRRINALNIPGIGQTLCQEIAARWPSLGSAFDEKDALKSVIGESNFNSLETFLFGNLEEIERLEAAGLIFEAEKSEKGALSGKVFCITGALISGSRDTVIRRIEEAGGLVKANVSKKVHYLVAGADGGNQKADGAKKHNVPVITEEQLYEMMGVAMPVSLNGPPDREY